MAKKRRKKAVPGEQESAPRREQSHVDPAPELPRWVPAAVYVALTVVLFREFVFSDLMLVGNDTLGLGLVARSFFADALDQGVFPLWAPLILGGTPFLEALSAGCSDYCLNKTARRGRSGNPAV